MATVLIDCNTERRRRVPQLQYKDISGMEPIPSVVYRIIIEQLSMVPTEQPNSSLPEHGGVPNATYVHSHAVDAEVS